MRIAIQNEGFSLELQVESSLNQFDKRGSLALRLIEAAVKASLKSCENITEDQLANEWMQCDWRDHDHIMRVFLDTDLFEQWTVTVKAECETMAWHEEDLYLADEE